MTAEAVLAIVAIGAVGGYLGGIVGAGVGATVVPGLILMGVDPVTAIGSSLLLHVLIAPIGGISHYKFGHFRRRVFVPLAIAGIIGAFVGGNVSLRLPSDGLKLLIGFSTIAAGLLITVRFPKNNNRHLTPKKIGKKLKRVKVPTVGLIALIAGLSHGAVGTGWGPLGVSLLILAGVYPHTAVGSSLLARSFVALAGASAYYFVGDSWAETVIPLLAGGAIAMILGALTAKRLKSKTLKKIVGVAVIVLGASVVLKLVI